MANGYNTTDDVLAAVKDGSLTIAEAGAILAEMGKKPDVEIPGRVVDEMMVWSAEFASKLETVLTKGNGKPKNSTNMGDVPIEAVLEKDTKGNDVPKFFFRVSLHRTNPAE